jgi:hypothetical protein
VSDALLPGDIRFFRAAIMTLNKNFEEQNRNLEELNRNLVILNERVSDENEDVARDENKMQEKLGLVEDEIRGKIDMDPNTTADPHGVWLPEDGGAYLWVNPWLAMKIHQIRDTSPDSHMDGLWAGFLEVMTADRDELWTILQTSPTKTEDEAKTLIRQATVLWMGDWNDNTIDLSKVIP